MIHCRVQIGLVLNDQRILRRHFLKKRRGQGRGAPPRIEHQQEEVCRLRLLDRVLDADLLDLIPAVCKPAVSKISIRQGPNIIKAEI